MSDYLTCAETAKLVRSALKREFPGVKFSVRSSTYSMGASISVRWTDGPTSDAVNRVAGAYAGADFDGMVDLKTYAQHWLEPNGTVAIAYGGAQGSTHPEVIGDPPSPRARLVHFGADFVHCQREHSDEFKARVIAHIERHYSLGTPGNKLDWNGRLESWQCWGSDLYYRISQKATRNEYGIAYAK